MTPAHLHLLLNHFPTVGMVLALAVYLLALIRKSSELKHTGMALFVMIALLSVAAYTSGNAAEGQLQKAKLSNVATAVIEAHQSQALGAFIFMQLTGVLAWFGLWKERRSSSSAGWITGGVFVLAAITFVWMALAASIGGEITHPEIRTTAEGNVNSAIDMLRGSAISSAVTEVVWIWAFCETLHFIGMSMLFGVVLLIDLRLLGVFKSVSFAQLHQYLPMAMAGYVINTFTGMVFFIAASGQYIENPVFFWKIALVMLAGANALYFTFFDGAWDVKANEDAPGFAKFAAASALVLWVGVIYAGRMLPFIGNAF